MAKVHEEKQVVEDRAAKLERELDKRENENRRLREEVAYLREHLESLPGGADVHPFKVRGSNCNASELLLRVQLQHVGGSHYDVPGIGCIPIVPGFSLLPMRAG